MKDTLKTVALIVLAPKACLAMGVATILVTVGACVVVTAKDKIEKHKAQKREES